MPKKIGPVLKVTWWIWKNRRQITAAVAMYGPRVGPALKRGTEVAVDRLRRHKVCVDCQKVVIDNPLAENRWCIARLGERCRLCKLRVDAFGHPIADSPGR